MTVDDSAARPGTDERAAGVTGSTRREALRRGALGGAALWTIPALQVIAAKSADAASGGGTPGGPPPPPPPPPKACRPAHGLLFFRVGGKTYGVKIDKSGAIGKLPRNAAYRVPTPRRWENYGKAVKGGKLAGNTGLFLLLPRGAVFVAAYAADPPPKGRGLETQFVAVRPNRSGKVVFVKAC